MTPHEIHNELVRKFIIEIVARTKTSSDLVVLTESMLFGVMHALTKVHGMTPAHSVEMINEAVLQATRRLAEVNNGKK